MNKKIYINSNKGPKPLGPYNQAVRVGQIVYTSGIIPINPKDGSIPKNIEDQTKLVLDSLKGIIEDSGGSLSDIVKITIFAVSINDFEKINDVYSSFFKDNFPARTCVGVFALPKNVLIEIEAVAIIE